MNNLGTIFPAQVRFSVVGRYLFAIVDGSLTGFCNGCFYWKLISTRSESWANTHPSRYAWFYVFGLFFGNISTMREISVHEPNIFGTWQSECSKEHENLSQKSCPQWARHDFLISRTCPNSLLVIWNTLYKLAARPPHATGLDSSHNLHDTFAWRSFF